MGFARGVADAMLESRAAGAESSAAHGWGEVDRLQRQLCEEKETTQAARNEIARLRSVITKMNADKARMTAGYLCCQSIAWGAAIVLVLNAKNDAILDRARSDVAAEARKLMLSQDSKNADNQQWVSLIEACKGLPFNQHLKIV